MCQERRGNTCGVHCKTIICVDMDRGKLDHLFKSISLTFTPHHWTMIHEDMHRDAPNLAIQEQASNQNPHDTATKAKSATCTALILQCRMVRCFSGDLNVLVLYIKRWRGKNNASFPAPFPTQHHLVVETVETIETVLLRRWRKISSSLATPTLLFAALADFFGMARQTATKGRP